MKRKDPLIVGRNSVRDMHHLRLMALLQELVRTWGYTGTARVLEIDLRTVTSSVQSGQLTHQVRESLQRALQHGVGSAADRQRERRLLEQLSVVRQKLSHGPLQRFVVLDSGVLPVGVRHCVLVPPVPSNLCGQLFGNHLLDLVLVLPLDGGTLKKCVNSQAVYALSETTRAQGPREEIHRLWEREALGVGRSQGRSGTSWRTGFEVRSRS